MPKPEQGFSTFHVDGTNAWVFKSDRGGFGLLLTGVAPPRDAPQLKYLRLSYRAEKLVAKAGKEQRVTRCLEVELDPTCDQETLARVLDRLVEEEPSGQYSSGLLVKTLNDVIKVVQAAAADAPREEVIGAWGELHLLYQLMLRARSHVAQMRLVNGWESEGERRDIIDFRFPHVRIAMEVKTTVGKRLHHFHGYKQVQTPPGYEHGFVASLAIQESDTRAGTTCSALVDQVMQTAVGKPQERLAVQRAFEEKLSVRGKACRDQNLRLSATADSLALISMDKVPRPLEAPLVTETEWTADVTECAPEPNPQRFLKAVAD